MSAVDDILGFMPSLTQQNSTQQAVSSMKMTPTDNAINSIAGVAGQAIGNAILPGIGGMIGGKALPLVTGAVESIIGGRKGKKAQGSLPGPEDVFERRRLAELDNQRKSFETGSAYASERKNLNNIQANAMRGAQRSAGGNVGALLSAMTRIGAESGDSFGKIAGEGQKRMDMKDAMYGDMVGKMAERRATLQMQNYTQQAEDAAEQKKTGNQLLLSTLGLGNLGKSPIPVMPQQNTVDNYIPPPSSLNMKPLFNPFQ